jgi:hypothetical protein
VAGGLEFDCGADLVDREATVVLLAACGGQPPATPAAASGGSSSPTPQRSGTVAATVVRFPVQLLGLKEAPSGSEMSMASEFDQTFNVPLAKNIGGHWATEEYGSSGTPDVTVSKLNFFVLGAAALPKPVASPDSYVRQIQGNFFSKGATVQFFPADASGVALICGPSENFIQCIWADHGSAGYVLYSGPRTASSVADGAAKTRQIHSAVIV